MNVLYSFSYFILQLSFTFLSYFTLTGIGSKRPRSGQSERRRRLFSAHLVCSVPVEASVCSAFGHRFGHTSQCTPPLWINPSLSTHGLYPFTPRVYSSVSVRSGQPSSYCYCQCQSAREGTGRDLGPEILLPGRAD